MTARGLSAPSRKRSGAARSRATLAGCLGPGRLARQFCGASAEAPVFRLKAEATFPLLPLFHFFHFSTSSTFPLFNFDIVIRLWPATPRTEKLAPTILKTDRSSSNGSGLFSGRVAGRRRQRGSAHRPRHRFEVGPGGRRVL